MSRNWDHLTEKQIKNKTILRGDIGLQNGLLIHSLPSQTNHDFHDYNIGK